jgi:hypothetical protein
MSKSLNPQTLRLKMQAKATRIDALEDRKLRFSRLGKATHELKTHVPEEIKHEWAAKASILGTTPSALLADLVIVNLRGPEFLKSLLDERLEALGELRAE